MKQVLQGSATCFTHERDAPGDGGEGRLGPAVERTADCSTAATSETRIAAVDDSAITAAAVSGAASPPTARGRATGDGEGDAPMPQQVIPVPVTPKPCLSRRVSLR